MTTTGGSAWTEIDNTMEDGYALAFGSIYQGGSYWDGTNSVPAVFKTTNDGANWSRYNLSTNRGEIYSIVIDPSNSDIVFAGGFFRISSDNAALYKTTNGGTNWTDLSTSFTADEIYCLCFDPNNPDRILAGTDDGVYVSNDDGANWTAPTTNVSVRCIVPDPTTPSKWFIGTSTGVYQSLNNGSNWTQINTGLSNTDVQCMEFDATNGVLYAGTDGGGVFRYNAGTDVDENNVADIPAEITLHQNFPNPFNMQTEIAYELPVNAKVFLAVYNVQGRRIRTLVDSHQTPGKKVVSWDGRDLNGNEVSSGLYIYRLKTDNTVDMKKMILQK